MLLPTVLPTLERNPINSSTRLRLGRWKFLLARERPEYRSCEGTNWKRHRAKQLPGRIGIQVEQAPLRIGCRPRALEAISTPAHIWSPLRPLRNGNRK